MDEAVKTTEQLLDELRALEQRLADLERVEQELRRNEALHVAIMDAIDDGVHASDAEGRFLAANAEKARREGTTKEDLLGKSPYDLYDPARARMVMDQCRHVMQTGEVMDVERAHPGARASYRSVHRAPIRDESGEIVGVVTVSRDISARRETEEALKRERDFTSAVIDTVGNLLVVLDRQASIVRTNRSFERVTGYSFEEVKDKPFWRVFPPADGATQGKNAFDRTLAGEFPNSDENRLITRDGRQRLIAWTNTALLDSAGRVEYVISAGSDITEQRQAEEDLRENNARLVKWVAELEQRNQESVLLNKMGDLLQTCLTFEEAYAVVADSAQKLFPSTAGGLFVISASRNLVDAVATWGDFPSGERVFTPDECWALRRGRVHVFGNPRSGLICQHVERPLPDSYLCVPMMAQGEILGSLHVRLEDETAGSAAAREQLAVTVAEHIALAMANLRLQKTLRDQAIHDLLTGLFNRRYLGEMLERELARARRRGSQVGIMMIDIDNFKQFNDLFGHEAGDALLSAIGNFLRSHVRGEDIACRYGGEEVSVILPDSSLEDTRRRAEELREGIKTLRVEHRRQYLGPVTVSVGVAVFPSHGDSGESVMRASDLALYQAKAEGRDRVVTAPR